MRRLWLACDDEDANTRLKLDALVANQWFRQADLSKAALGASESGCTSMGFLGV